MYIIEQSGQKTPYRKKYICFITNNFSSSPLIWHMGMLFNS